jgi:hypothetical protein
VYGLRYVAREARLRQSSGVRDVGGLVFQMSGLDLEGFVVQHIRDLSCMKERTISHDLFEARAWV